MNIQFVFPYGQLPVWLLLGVLALLALYYGLSRLEAHRSRRIDRFVEAKLAPRLLAGYDARVRKPLFWLVFFGLSALLVALAQPRWGQAMVPSTRASRDVLVVLDTSLSMNAQNPQPDRLSRAKSKIEALLDRMPGDRFGLIAFSGGAAIQCPMTLDHAYFRSILNVVNTDTITELGTNIEAALNEARALFQKEAEETGINEPGARAVLLISDGEQVRGEALRAAEALANYATINVMGIGDPEGAVVMFPQHLRRFTANQTMPMQHLSKLDEENLISIAERGGGVYVRSVAHNGDVDRIIDEIDYMRARAVSDDIRMSMVNRYRWPLAVALFCFAAEGFWLAAMPWLRQWRMKRGEGSAHA